MSRGIFVCKDCGVVRKGTKFVIGKLVERHKDCDSDYTYSLPDNDYNKSNLRNFIKWIVSDENNN